MDYFYKELKMKTNIKTHTKSYLKSCSAMVIFSLLTFTSASSIAQSDVIQQTNASAVTQTKELTTVIYLNNSSMEQLETLKGVGHKKAQAIIAYREQVGSFKSVEEITQVKGIGEKVLSDNKARLQI